MPLVQLYNDSISAMCRDYSPRFRAVASLPLASIDEAAKEFERTIQMPGMIGVALPGDGFVTQKAAQSFHPLLDIANTHHALVFIHRATLPGTPGDRPKKGVVNYLERDSTLHMQANISEIMVTLCLTYILDDYHNPQVMTHNLGGNIPFEIERMDHRAMTSNPDRELPSVLFQRSPVLLDCNSLGPRAIERGAEVYGAHRILFGTDGSDFGATWSQDAIAQSQLQETERAAILHDNAARILALVDQHN